MDEYIFKQPARAFHHMTTRVAGRTGERVPIGWQLNRSAEVFIARAVDVPVVGLPGLELMFRVKDALVFL